MSFKDFLCCCFVIVIFRPVYSQYIRPGKQSESERACQKYGDLKGNWITTEVCIEDNGFDPNRAQRNEFPHMVAIGYEVEQVEDYTFLCSGSLISDKFVLTVAHCVNNRNLVPKIVRLGKTSKNSEDCNDAIDVGVIFEPMKMIHNGYNARSKHSDIALLELQESVEQYYSNSLFPACLHLGYKFKTDLIETGWGYAHFEEGLINKKINNTYVVGRFHSNWLLKGNTQEISIATCNDALKKVRVIITGSQFCAKTNEKDLCITDGGSPLQYKLNNMYYVAGVGSGYFGCGSELPTINTRVSSYIDWIENIVWPGN